MESSFQQGIRGHLYTQSIVLFVIRYWFEISYMQVCAIAIVCGVIFLTNHTVARCTIGCWRDTVVCPSFCLWRCALRLNDASYMNSVWTSESDMPSSPPVPGRQFYLLTLSFQTPTSSTIDIGAIWQKNKTMLQTSELPKFPTSGIPTISMLHGCSK